MRASGHLSRREHPMTPGDLIRFAWSFIWPENATGLRIRVVIALVCLIIAKLFNIGIPFALKSIIDALDQETLLILPVAAIAAYGLARAGSIAFRELRDAVFAKVGQRAGRTLALSVYRHLFNLSLPFHLEKRTGELARAIDRGVKALSFLLRAVVFSLGPTLFEFVMVIGILWVTYDFRYAAIVFTTIVLYAIFTVKTTNWRTAIRREMNVQDNAFNAAAVDGLINYETVKVFTNEEHEAAKLDTALRYYEKAAIRSENTLAFLNIGQSVIVTAGVIILITLASYEVVQGDLSLGDVVLLNTFLLQLYQPLNILGSIYREVRQSVTDLENIQGLLIRKPAITDHEHARPLKLQGPAISFHDVAFSYDPRRSVIDRLDVKIGAGEKLAVVGSSGAGKSTVMRLLLRFYDPSSGSITIDGQDLRNITQRSLREAIGVVPQDTVLFNDTIVANIAYGRPGASAQEIEEAARHAQLHDFISQLPDGYETMVGERGLKLSGGEKQRVAIARVLLKNPPILILDEATSALDSKTEQELQAALDQAAKGRTSLVIAHRLSTIIRADKIIVLEQGFVKEEGRHEELLELDGIYAGLWRRQLEGQET